MTPPQKSSIRADIQGVRAIAVGAVVIYHLWPARLPGGFVGVDIFFVVSGFLITAHILRGIEGRRFGAFLVSFYTKRVRRLAPAAATVLIATCVAIVALTPIGSWRDELSHVVASTFFFENWHLAAQSVDYLAADSGGASPLQHFWSLSVEEQFYIFWPLLLIALALLARRRSALIAAIGVFTAVSFAYGVWATGASPDSAYFSTLTRAWQFGCGALASFVIVRSRALAFALPWIGAALALASLFVIRGEGDYPGLIALLPTLATVMMLLGREEESRWSMGAVSSFAPIRWLGDVSYSVYLWHWPLIVFVPVALGRELTLPLKLLVLALSLALGHLSYRWIETPVRRSPRLATAPRTVALAAAALALVMVPTVAASTVAQRTEDQASLALQRQASDMPACFGALSIDDPGCDPDTKITPDEAAAAEEDLPLPWTDECDDNLGAMTEVLCEYGDPNGDTRVLLWGDSHAGSWAPAFANAGELGRFSVTVAMRHGCPSTSSAPTATSMGRTITAEEQRNCQKRNDWVLESLVPQYDVVVLANMTTNYTFSVDAGAAFADQVDAAARAGAEVVVMQDVPLTGDKQGNRVNGPKCLAEHGSCSNPVERALDTGAVADEIAQRATQPYRFIETSDRFCDAERCDYARGGVSVYFDQSHLSNSYSRSLGPWLRDELALER